MFAIQSSVSILWLPLMALGGAIVGFIFRSRQIEKSKKRILSLENEMLNNHAEILRLQRELVTLEKSLPLNKTRVVSIKDAQFDENAETPDGTQRKLSTK